MHFLKTILCNSTHALSESLRDGAGEQARLLVLFLEHGTYLPSCSFTDGRLQLFSELFGGVGYGGVLCTTAVHVDLYPEVRARFVAKHKSS